jgi:hypothetical protein
MESGSWGPSFLQPTHNINNYNTVVNTSSPPFLTHNSYTHVVPPLSPQQLFTRSITPDPRVLKRPPSHHPTTPDISTTKRSKTVFSPGDLGKNATLMATRIAELGWHGFIRSQQQSSINAHIHQVPHPMASYLHRLQKRGVLAPTTGLPWMTMQRHEAFLRGSHPSATCHYAQFLREDMWDYIQMGFWTVVPYTAV